MRRLMEPGPQKDAEFAKYQKAMLDYNLTLSSCHEKYKIPCTPPPGTWTGNDWLLYDQTGQIPK